MQLKPEEISKVIRSQIKYYQNAIEQSETGTVLIVGDGIARVSGLTNCFLFLRIELASPLLPCYSIATIRSMQSGNL